jgi:hypothetical protein
MGDNLTSLAKVVNDVPHLESGLCSHLFVRTRLDEEGNCRGTTLWAWIRLADVIGELAEQLLARCKGDFATSAVLHRRMIASQDRHLQVEVLDGLFLLCRTLHRVSHRGPRGFFHCFHRIAVE